MKLKDVLPQDEWVRSLFIIFTLAFVFIFSLSFAGIISDHTLKTKGFQVETLRLETRYQELKVEELKLRMGAECLQKLDANSATQVLSF